MCATALQCRTIAAVYLTQQQQLKLLISLETVILSRQQQQLALQSAWNWRQTYRKVSFCSVLCT